MNVCKMIIDSSESSTTNDSIKKETLPSIYQLPINNNKRKSMSDPHHKYQLQYRLQHKFLKTYNDPPSQIDSPQEFPPLQFQGSPSSSQSLTLPPIQNLSDMNNMNTQFNMDNHLLKQVIEQCTGIYQKIGKYRRDPLRESERNQIIDEVYYTAENMLKSLQELDSKSDTDHLTEDETKNDLEMNLTDNEANTEEYQMIRMARNLQKNSQPKYRRRNRNNMVGLRCHSCNTTETPEWRRGPDGARTLCNACGLHYAKLLKKGSLTVQTHNYTIKSPPSDEKIHRPMKFPIIQVNKNSLIGNNSSSSSNSNNNSNKKNMLNHDDPHYVTTSNIKIIELDNTFDEKDLHT